MSEDEQPPAPPDEVVYDRPVRRIRRLIVIIGLGISGVLVFIYGVSVGAGFLAGAAVSYASFWRWRRVVEALSPPAAEGETNPPPRAGAWTFMVRFAAIAVIAYVIVKYLRVNLMAAAAGLLVAAAAVIAEIIYELIHGL